MRLRVGNKSYDVGLLGEGETAVQIICDTLLEQGWAVPTSTCAASSVTNETCGAIRKGFSKSLPCVLRQEHIGYHADELDNIWTKKFGTVCTNCGHEVKIRELFVGTFVGCMC